MRLGSESVKRGEDAETAETDSDPTADKDGCKDGVAKTWEFE